MHISRAQETWQPMYSTGHKYEIKQVSTFEHHIVRATLCTVIRKGFICETSKIRQHIQSTFSTGVPSRPSDGIQEYFFLVHVLERAPFFTAPAPRQRTEATGLFLAPTRKLCLVKTHSPGIIWGEYSCHFPRNAVEDGSTFFTFFIFFEMPSRNAEMAGTFSQSKIARKG